MRVTLSRPSTSLLSWIDRSKSQAEPSGVCTWKGKKGLYLERHRTHAKSSINDQSSDGGWLMNGLNCRSNTLKVIFKSQFCCCTECTYPTSASTSGCCQSGVQWYFYEYWRLWGMCMCARAWLTCGSYQKSCGYTKSIKLWTVRKAWSIQNSLITVWLISSQKSFNKEVAIIPHA